MVPTFTSQTDMMGFLHALPTNAAYVKMLRDDFNIDLPEDAEEYQKEYVFKYAVQGQYEGKSGDALKQYAFKQAEKLAADLPHIVTKYYSDDNPKPINTVDATPKTPKAPKVVMPEGATKFERVLKLVTATTVGIIKFNQKTQQFDAWIEGVHVSHKKDEAAVRAVFAKYGVTKVETQ